ncbi:MAG: hypothetical protein WCO68_03060 [Verrucomicrobiota bacterium]
MAPIIADVVWPALYLEQRLFSWWAIGLGLLVELVFLRRITTLSSGMCIVADLAMNAASALLGIVLIPVVGLLWEVFPGILLYKLFKVGTFNPGTWTATFILAVFVNAVLETTVLRYAFHQKPAKRIFGWLCLANGLSIALAFISLFVYPLHL